jgi:hypothetical protein
MKLSKKEFLEKYYPIEARTLENSSWEDCLKHSIRKWWGQRHKLSTKPSDRFGEMCHGETCALCHKSHKIHFSKAIEFSSYCNECPIEVFTHACSDYRSSWRKSMKLKTGYAMLKTLVFALREVRENPKRWS